MALSPSELVPSVKPYSASHKADQREIEADIEAQDTADIGCQSIVVYERFLNE